MKFPLFYLPKLKVAEFKTNSSCWKTKQHLSFATLAGISKSLLSFFTLLLKKKSFYLYVSSCLLFGRRLFHMCRKRSFFVLNEHLGCEDQEKFCHKVPQMICHNVHNSCVLHSYARIIHFLCQTSLDISCIHTYLCCRLHETFECVFWGRLVHCRKREK